MRSCLMRSGAYESGAMMRCPKCKREKLRAAVEGVSCDFCGHVLSPGEEQRFKVFKLLREEKDKA